MLRGFNRTNCPVREDEKRETLCTLIDVGLMAQSLAFLCIAAFEYVTQSPILITLPGPGPLFHCTDSGVWRRTAILLSFAAGNCDNWTHFAFGVGHRALAKKASRPQVKWH